MLFAAEQQEAGETLGGFWKEKTETPFEGIKKTESEFEGEGDERQSWNSGSVEGEEEKKEEVHVQENQKEIDNNGSFEGENLLEFDGRERWVFAF